ncbi:MAG TPA: chemotaxis protein CheW [Burkholderiales bacterium]|nr:chemotaxis protein CheW [Burkholderiales bacterium]
MAQRISLRDYQRELAERLRAADSARNASKLGLQVGAQRWLIDLAEAGEVIPVPPITPVPLTQPWFRGVANIRGNLCSVVDFAAFLGASPAPPGEQARLVLFGARFRTGGALLVDRSLGLRNAEELQPQSASGPQAAWLKGEYSDAQGERWKELDVAQLVADPGFLAVGA